MKKQTIRSVVESTLFSLGEAKPTRIDEVGRLPKGSANWVLRQLRDLGLAYVHHWEPAGNKLNPNILAGVWRLGAGRSAPRPLKTPRQFIGVEPDTSGDRTPGLQLDYPIKSRFVGGVNPWTGA
jgi:hypothetical protein